MFGAPAQQPARLVRVALQAWARPAGGSIRHRTDLRAACRCMTGHTGCEVLPNSCRRGGRAQQLACADPAVLTVLTEWPGRPTSMKHAHALPPMLVTRMHAGGARVLHNHRGAASGRPRRARRAPAVDRRGRCAQGGTRMRSGRRRLAGRRRGMQPCSLCARLRARPGVRCGCRGCAGCS